MDGKLQNVLHVIWQGWKVIVECHKQHTTAECIVYDRNVSVQKVFGIQWFNMLYMTRCECRSCLGYNGTIP